MSPVWTAPPSEGLRNALDSVIAGLGDEVSDDPAFEQVVGIPMEVAAQHAAEAVAMFIRSGGGNLEMGPDNLMKLYIMGLIVGTKYQHQRATETPES